MPNVLILASHRAVAADRLVDRLTSQLQAKLGPADVLVHVDDLRRLGPAMLPRPDVVLAPLAYEGDGGFRAAVSAVRALAPDVPIIACCDVSVSPEALVIAADAQVDHFAIPAVDDINVVVRDVMAPQGAMHDPESRRARPVDPCDGLIAALPSMAAKLMIAASSDAPPQTAADLAHVVGLGERTLVRRCARYEWPSPTLMLRYGKLLRGMRVALATGSVEEGALAADCPGDRRRAATHFRTRLAAATDGELRKPLTEGLAPLCRAIARRFGITEEGERPRRRPARGRGARRAPLPPEGAWLEEGRHHRAERADRA